MKSSNISVVILFYRTPEKVITRLNNYKDFDLYILDQSNDLKLKEKVKKIFPKIKYYGVSNENKGFAKGINFLVKKVKTKYFLCTQPDTDISKKSILRLKKTLEVKKDSIISVPRIKQFKKNFNLFGAPVGIFVFINRSMGYPQWSDLGMFVQSVLLLAKENNLDTCAQESWALFHKLVHKQVKAPKEYMLFCGIAVGHMDKTNVINKIRTERANIDDLAEFFGFED